MKTLGLIAIVLTTCAFAGCSVDTVKDAPVANKAVANEKGEAFGPASTDERFAPYQGKWNLESRTFDPPIEGNKLTSGSLNVKGHIIQIGSGTVSFRLCQVRQAGNGIEADAYRVDDDEPNDIQRFECKLKPVGDKLEFRWRSVEAETATNDPIFAAADYTPPNRPLTPAAPWWIEMYSKMP